jgi:hypothetical protein
MTHGKFEVLTIIGLANLQARGKVNTLTKEFYELVSNFLQKIGTFELFATKS